MAIGIIAIAFVALFALLPVGLTGLRNSMDTANETWIMQGVNSMVQTTEWEKIYGPTATITKDTYYFDEEGRLTDTKEKVSTDTKVQLSRIYQVKLFVEPLYRPTAGATREVITATPPGANQQAGKPVAVRVVAVMANLTNGEATRQFDAVTDMSAVRSLAKNASLSVRSFVATQMNAAK